MNQTVLLAGATGMLGRRIAHHLLAQDDVSLRLLIRSATSDRPETRQLLQPLREAGAEVVVGDLRDATALAAAADGTDVVMSAVQGGRETVVDGQVALAAAAHRAGARRFLPSDYALDVFRSTPGELVSYDLRREAGERIAELGIEQVHVLNGAFLDMFVHPRGALELDHEQGTATFWGSGTERFEATGVDDTAHYAALAALDRDLPAGKFAVAAQRIGFGDMIDAIEEASGRRYERVSRGSVDDVREMAAKARAEDPASPSATMSGYLLYMLSGQTALSDLGNERYPQVQPRTYREMVGTA
jgi:nucleoside-diphosphate-sugar epimerase